MRCVALHALLLLACAGPAHADFVFGCALQDGKMPRIVLKLLNSNQQVVSTFDTALHAQWSMPGQFQQPLADGTLQIEYVADDLRAMYGDLKQFLSVQFADNLPPSGAAKHPSGRADDIPIGEARPVTEWLGTTTYFTVSGLVTDQVNTTPCQWFCQFDIDWQAAPVESSSFGAIKALY